MRKLSIKKQQYFFERIKILLDASLPLSECLSFLAKNETDILFKKMYSQIEEQVTDGNTLASALHIYSERFNPLTLTFISSGEEHGALASSINYLCQELSKSQELRSKIISLCIYPSIILFMTLLLSGFLIIFIIPKIQGLFVSLDATLPLSTRLLIQISEITRRFGIYIAVSLCIGIFTVRFSIRRYYSLRKKVDIAMLKIPVIGDIKTKYELARICRNIGTALSSGLTLDQSLQSATEGTYHSLYNETLVSLQKSTQDGISLQNSLASFTKYVPPIASSLISVAEKAGTLASMFLYIGELYEKEVSALVKKASTVAEPLLIAIMGIVVGSIAISIITPIYQITQHLKA